MAQQWANVVNGTMHQRGRRDNAANGTTCQPTDTPTNLTAIFPDTIGWFRKSDWSDLRNNGT